MGKVKKIILLLLVVFVMSGCQKNTDLTKKVRDIDYTVVQKEKVPKDLKEAMEEKQEKGFKLTYVDGEFLYIAMGFGKKDTLGYSVSVKELYQTKNGIFFDTELTGPKEEDVISGSASYPCVVVKLEYVDGSVIFN